MSRVENPADSLASSVMKPRGKAGSDSAIAGAGFQEVYKPIEAARKTQSQLSDGSTDMEKVLASIEEAAGFSMNMLLSSVKNMGLPGEDGDGNKGEEMMKIAMGIADSMRAKAQVNAQIKAMELSKNPAVDLMSLKGKQVEYDDSKRDFYDKPVSYNYKISHNEKDPTASVNLTFTIRDEKGIAVKTVRQSGKVGESSFKWNGENDNGRLMPSGTYSLDVEADGRKTAGGISVPFPVTASTTLVGFVEGVKIKDGTAIGVVINGHVIPRDKISDVRDMPEAKLAVPFTSDLIGRTLELDFSKAKVQKDGSMEVYFNNHVENPGDLTVEIYDKDKKLITSVTNNESIGTGVGKISFPQMKIDPDVYDIKVSVQDKQDPDNVKDVKLKYDASIIVGGIDVSNKTIISTANEIYDSIHITRVLGDYNTPIEQRRADLVGSQVAYRDDLFKFAADEATSFTFERSKDDSVISHGRMDVYDDKSGEYITSINAEYDLNALLDYDSREKIKSYLRDNHATDDYDSTTGEDRVETNRYIKDEIAQDNLVISAGSKESYDKGQIALSFPAWDGLKPDGSMVDASQPLRRDYTPIYSRDSDGSVYPGATDKSVIIANVDYVDEVEGELELHLLGGSVIQEELVLNHRKL